MEPIRRAPHVAVFYRVPAEAVHMAPAVQPVPDAVLPEPPLPDAAPPLGSGFGAPFIALKYPVEGRFDRPQRVK